MLDSSVTRRPNGKPRSSDVGERTGYCDIGGDDEYDEVVWFSDSGGVLGCVEMTGKLLCAARLLAKTFFLRTLTVVMALARTLCAVVAVTMLVVVVGEIGGLGIQGLANSSDSIGDEGGARGDDLVLGVTETMFDLRNGFWPNRFIDLRQYLLSGMVEVVVRSVAGEGVVRLEVVQGEIGDDEPRDERGLDVEAEE